MKKLGICQSRGLGDICMALPIAKYYYDEGIQVYWPICQEFLPSFINSAPWVNWIPIVTDTIGNFFYNTPIEKLNKVLFQNLVMFRGFKYKNLMNLSILKQEFRLRTNGNYPNALQEIW